MLSIKTHRMKFNSRQEIKSVFWLQTHRMHSWSRQWPTFINVIDICYIGWWILLENASRRTWSRPEWGVFKSYWRKLLFLNTQQTGLRREQPSAAGTGERRSVSRIHLKLSVCHATQSDWGVLHGNKLGPICKIRATECPGWLGVWRFE